MVNTLSKSAEEELACGITSSRPRTKITKRPYSLRNLFCFGIDSCRLLAPSDRTNQLDCRSTLGIAPMQKAFMLKSRIHWRAGLGAMAKAVVEYAGMGVSNSDYTELPFTKVRRPIYPLDLSNRGNYTGSTPVLRVERTDGRHRAPARERTALSFGTHWTYVPRSTRRRCWLPRAGGDLSARPAEPMSATAGLLAGFRRRLRPASSGRAARPERAKVGIAPVSANFAGIDAIKPISPLPGIDTFFLYRRRRLPMPIPKSSRPGEGSSSLITRATISGRGCGQNTSSFRSIACPKRSPIAGSPGPTRPSSFATPRFWCAEPERLALLAPHQRLALLPHPDRNTIREEYVFITGDRQRRRISSEYLLVRAPRRK